jgi:hypothetical protein
VLLYSCSHLGTGTSPEPQAKPKPSLLVQPYFDFGKNKGGIIIVNLATGECYEHPTEFGVHHISYDPLKKIFVGANKYGKKYLTFKDIRMTDLEYFDLLDADYSLSGHVLCSPSPEIKDYYFSGIQLSTSKNSIIKINKETHAVAAHAVFEKTSPPVHDIKWIPGTNTVVATAGKKIHYFDLNQPGHHSVRHIETAFADSSIRHFEIFQDVVTIQSNIISGDYKYRAAEVITLNKKDILRKTVGDFFSELKDSEILDLAISSDSGYVAVAHDGAPVVTVINLKTGIFSKIGFKERIFRVCQWPGANDLLVISNRNLYRLNPATAFFSKVELKNNLLSDSYHYIHRTVVEI